MDKRLIFIIFEKTTKMNNLISKKMLFAALGIMLMCFLFTSCASQASVLSTDPYGFWGGLWHGIITPFSFIGSLFSDDIAVYACDNSGGWYDFGFLLGVGGLGFTIKTTR